MISIDVVIANRNNSRYLRQCIDSVLSQTLPPKEIIVVDDASDDDSRLVLETYASSGKITYIQNTTSKGVAATRNRGIDHGRSPFITTLDADDFYHNTHKLYAEALAIEKSGPHTIAFSDVMRTNEKGEDQWLFSSKRKVREGDISFNISHLKGFIPRDYLVSREDYQKAGGYNPDLYLYEDWDLKIRLAKLCSWRFSGVVGTAYRNNSNGLSKAPSKEHIETMRDIFRNNNAAGASISDRLALGRFFFYHSIYMGRIAL